jgi:adenylate cyclase
MGDADSTFERALADEIMASERLRVRVLVTALAVLPVILQFLFLYFPDISQRLASRPVPLWMPSAIFAPFLFYEGVVLFILSRRRTMPTPARFANALIETSLPTAILWNVSYYASPETAFGTWPALLYFTFIVAATLRLDFVLPMFTGAVAAVSYMAVVMWELPLSMAAAEPILNPLYHLTKSGMMLLAGIVAGLVAVRLRAKFIHAMQEAAARERVTNLFGQHVSPAVVDRLLDAPAEFAGELREICVMFLDIRDFTHHSRSRPPAEVVAYLNDVFAFMIEAVDRHGGFINKFLGDGFMAVFGAPLEDREAAAHAVATARDILEEIDRSGRAESSWPLHIGIGLHFGPAITGNVGSPRRKEFTAIGDTVNLAARLEQLNKEFHSRLLVSDAVVEALDPATRPASPLAAVPVKGYPEPVRVWRLA